MKTLQAIKARKILRRIEVEAIEFAKENGFHVDYSYTSEAVDVNPDIFIYRFITRTSQELKLAKEEKLTDLVAEEVQRRLKLYGYPFDKTDEATVIFESQENIDRLCDGNAYIYFK